jgi:dTDP-4-amino-4,6-dideoxygalactose transaminase
MLQPAYSGLMSQEDVLNKYANARKVTTDTFFLGTSPVITSEQIDYIEHVVTNFFKRYEP